MKTFITCLMIAFFIKGSCFAQLSNVLSLTVGGNGCSSDQTILRFLPDATDSFDSEYDAYKFMNPNNTPNFYTESDLQYAISALNDRFSLKTVQLDFKAYVSGTYTIDIEQLGSFDSTWTITLKDNATQQSMDLMATSTYTFAALNSDCPSRFSVIFTHAEKQESFDQLTTGITKGADFEDKLIYSSDNQILVNGSHLSSLASISVRDLSGTPVTQAETTATDWSFTPMISGVYLVNVVSDNKHYFKKIYVY